MEKRVIRISIIIIMFLLIVFTISEILVVNAAFKVKDNFSGAALDGNAGVDQTRKILGAVLNVIRFFGAGIAIIILTTLGGKYMLASAGEKAEIKKHAITYIIGAVVMMAASGIVSILYEFTKNTTQ